MHTAGTLDSKPSEAAMLETRSKLIWCSLVVGLLTLQVLGCIFAAVLATSSKSMAVLPDYHQKALMWDELREQQAELQQLGWKQVVDASPVMDVYGNRLLTIRIEDRDGEAVDVQRVEVMVYHHARADRTYEPEMEELAPGTFRGKVWLKKEGLWQVQTKVFAEGREIEMILEHKVKDETER